MIVTRRTVWTATLPRHAHAFSTVARMFAAQAGLGAVTQETTAPLGPYQFHVEGSGETHEIGRSEEPDGRHRFDVVALRRAI